MENGDHKKIIRYTDFVEYEKVIGTLYGEDLEEHKVSIKPCLHIVGWFRPDRLSELKDFVAANPNYHIASLLPVIGSHVNGISKGATYYYLCDGDKNPNLFLSDIISYEEYQLSLEDKLWHDECFAERCKIKNQG